MFTRLIERIAGATPHLAFPARMSLQLYREAMNEEADIWRFVALWLSLEVLDAPLRARYRQQGIGLVGGGQHPGLETLERERGRKLRVRIANAARNDLLHVNEVDGQELLARTSELIQDLETLVPVAWEELLGIDGWAADHPTEATTTHPVEYVVTMRFTSTPGSTFGPGQHPVLVLECEIPPAERADDAGYSLPVEYRVTKGKGVASFDPVSYELRGPQGPIEMEMGEVTVERDDLEDASTS